jgi:hypothetical protein
MAHHDPTAFLAEKADAFRVFASQWPDLASELRQMAEECEQVAAELPRDRRRSARLTPLQNRTAQNRTAQNRPAQNRPASPGPTLRPRSE